MVDVEEIVDVGDARWWAVEVRGRAHHDDPAEIREVLRRAAEEGLQTGVVFLCGGAVDPGAVGEEFCRVLEGLAQERAAVVHVRGSDVAGDDTGGRGGGGVRGDRGVERAVRGGGGGVVQGGGGGEGDGHVAQGGVDFEDFGAIDVDGVLIGGEGAQRDVSRGEVGGDLARVELVLEGDLHGVFGEGDGREGRDFGVDAGDAGDHEVRFAKVEVPGEDEGGDAGRGVDFGFACDHLADFARGGAVSFGEEGGKAGDCDILREEVKFGDPVPDVCFGSEHVDHEDLWREGLRAFLEVGELGEGGC